MHNLVFFDVFGVFFSVFSNKVLFVLQTVCIHYCVLVTENVLL